MGSNTPGYSPAGSCKMLLCQMLTAIAFCLTIMSSEPVRAQQSATAVLTGTIKDQNDAVVQGATVTVRQQSTGVVRETTSNDQGSFVVTNLASDIYQVRVQAKGFAEKL